MDMPEKDGARKLPKKYYFLCLKIFVKLACLTGLLYDSYQFLDLYWGYPTTANSQTLYPTEIVQPAITVCNQERQRFSAVCNSSRADWDTTGKFKCSGLELKNNVDYSDIPNSWENAAYEAFPENMIKSCKKHVNGEVYECEKPYLRVPIVTYEGEPNFCYTIESQLGKPDSKPKVYPNILRIVIELHIDRKELMMQSFDSMMFVSIHDRRSWQNPSLYGYSMKLGEMYEAFVSMEEEILLPPPYDTMCVDYEKLWKDNNGTGPLSFSACTEKCKLDLLLAEGKCIDKTTQYPHMERLCRKDELVTTKEMLEKCSQRCGRACVKNTYTTKYNFRGFQKEDKMNYFVSGIFDSDVTLTIYFDNFELHRTVYEQKFESLELFSVIGSELGLWMGFSILSIVDLFEVLGNIIYYRVTNSRKNHSKKKKVKALRVSYETRDRSERF